MYFKSLQIKEWQQFKNIEIDFHERLTVLTGANGSGKTTILNLLAKHFGWALHSLATPKKEEKTGIIKYLTRLFNGRNLIRNEDINQNSIIGNLIYGNGKEASLQIPNTNTLQYQLIIKNQQNVKCFYIPSHRSIFRYQAIDNIPIAKKNKETAFQEASQNIRERYFGSSGQASSYMMKNTLIGWAIQGYGVQHNTKSIMAKDHEQMGFYEGFQEVLKKLLPKSLRFQEFEIRNMEIVFVCNDVKDEFVFESASGGISAIIDIAWQIYMYSTKENDDFTVIIDEIENHLHPTMQRQILPDLLNAFPSARFVVATHSPLVVGSVKNSRIYALKYNNESKIESEKLDFEKHPKTASEILDEVLGVSFTMPIWAEEALKEIVNKYSGKSMTKEDFGQMRRDLANVGMERLMPSVISNIVGSDND